jgi:hypothetical protein
MSTFLGYLGLALILGGVFGCMVMAIANMAIGNSTPDNDSGAPEGATIIRFNPDGQSSSR